MKFIHSGALGLGFTAVMCGTASTLLGAREYVQVPVIWQFLEILGGVAVVALFPGAPLGMLSLNVHGTAFIVLTIIGDVIFYSIVANWLLARREQKGRLE